jgi:hypothetical protein
VVLVDGLLVAPLLLLVLLVLAAAVRRAVRLPQLLLLRLRQVLVLVLQLLQRDAQSVDVVHLLLLTLLLNDLLDLRLLLLLLRTPLVDLVHDQLVQLVGNPNSRGMYGDGLSLRSLSDLVS